MQDIVKATSSVDIELIIAITHCSATTCISHWPRVGVYKMRKALRRNDLGQSTKVLKQSAASLIAEKIETGNVRLCKHLS